MIDPAATGTLFMPPQASTVAAEVDNLYYFIYYLCCFFFGLIMVGGLYFVVKYRHREGGPKAVPISHHTLLELTWSVIPLFLLIIIFAWGYRGYLDLYVPPKADMEIHVAAKRWAWQFEHADGTHEGGELHVPVHKVVKLIMTSQDDPAGNVLHSFFVPAFRVKSDVVPNRYTTIWFEATKTGSFQVFCTEYCGTGHSGMLAQVIVMEEPEFNRWLDSVNKPPWETEEGKTKHVTMAEVSQEQFTKNACVTCHSAAPGGAAVGPPLYHKFGTQETLSDGSQVLIDENYIRESITKPAAKVVKGFQPVMPPFEGILKDWQILSLIEYIKSLK